MLDVDNYLVMSWSVTTYPFPWGHRLLLLEPISLDKLPAHRRALTDEQCGVKYLAQGHFDMQLSPARSRDLNLPITSRPALPP